MQEKLKGAGGAQPYGLPNRTGHTQGFYGSNNSSGLTRENQIYHNGGYGYDDSQDMNQNDLNAAFQAANGRKLDRNSMVFIPNHGNTKGNMGKTTLSNFNGYANQDPSGRMAPSNIDSRPKGFVNPNQPQHPNLATGPNGQPMTRNEYWADRPGGYQGQPQGTRLAPQGQPQFGHPNLLPQNRVGKFGPQSETSSGSGNPQFQQMPMHQPVVTQPHSAQYLLNQHQAEQTKMLMDQLVSNIIKLRDEHLRPEAMGQLINIKDRQMPRPFAKILWESAGAVAGLLTEVVGLYSHLSKPVVSPQTIERGKHALALFLPIISYEETKKGFMAARMDQYFYPIISWANPQKSQTEDLVSASFAVICGILKKPEPGTIQLLVKTTRLFEICVNNMKSASGATLSLSIFIMFRLLSDPQVVLDVTNHTPTLETLLEGLIKVLTGVLEKSLQGGNLVDQDKKLLPGVFASLDKLSETEPGKSRILQALPASAKQPSANIFKDSELQPKYDKLLKNLGLLN